MNTIPNSRAMCNIQLNIIINFSLNNLTTMSMLVEPVIGAIKAIPVKDRQY